jgi:hypothetical protein
MRSFIIAAAMLAVLVAPAAAAEVPSQYRGLWCDLPGSGGSLYRRCRHATSEGYLDIRRHRIGDFEEYGACRIRNVTPFRNGHRLALRCPTTESDVELAEIKLRLDARGRLRAEIEWREK